MKTEMLKYMNEAMAYIEEHLTSEIDVKYAAGLAHCSEYHFRRMFSFLSGVSLSEHIRRRRLSLAAIDLSGSSMRVLDVALAYGYHSADSFARAFYALHGLTPTEARSHGSSLTSYPPMRFKLTLEGVENMKYRIEKREPFTITGIMKRVPIIFEGENPHITQMWQSITPGMIERLLELSDTEPKGMIQASVHFSETRMEEKGELDHYIGVATTQDVHDETFSQLEVPASEWAVFETDGPFPQALQQTWGRIFSEWFPSSSFQLAQGPEILSIKSRDLSADSVPCEIWIPVVR
jgi:AraC family transcriptional regulator